MKNTILKATFIAALSIFASCSDDDEEIVDIPTDILYKGKLDYTVGTAVDVSGWAWKDASLSITSSENELEGTIDSDVTLDGEYQLTGTYIVADGATLTIEAGSEIVAIPGSGVSAFETNIVVLKGGKIVVNGTAADPVILSSPNANAADWGGLIICGKGITSAGTDVDFEVGNYPYGGTDADDNSGSISYLVLKGSGAQIDAESQTNGISFCAVGSGTTINNISVTNGGDDGVEFYGGSVEATNVYLKNNLDDAVDWTEAWDGGIENVYIYHDVQGFSTVFEGDKDNANPTFTNVTAISTTGGTALQFKKESGAIITNLHLDGHDLEIDFKDEGAFSNVQIDGADAKIIGNE